MHFHHYTLRQLADTLNETHRGEEIYACYSQSKNELVIELDTLYLRIGCHTPQTYIIPVSAYTKARKNVVDLFPEIIGHKLVSIRVIPWERVLILELDRNIQLICKLHGPQANVMMAKAGEVKRIFVKEREKDWVFEEEPGLFDETQMVWDVPVEELNPKSVFDQIRKVSPIFDRQFAAKVYVRMQQGSDFGEALKAVIAEAEDETFFIRKESHKIRLYVFKPEGDGEIIEVKGVAKALQAYLTAHFQFESYRKFYQQVKKEVAKPYQKFQKVLASYQKNIDKLESEREPAEIGHILMANIHMLKTLKAGEEKVVLDDFYTNEEITIKLKKTLGPTANAERYYDKSKQQKARLKYMRSQLEDIEQKMLDAQEEWEAFTELPSPENLPFAPSGFDTPKLRELKKMLKKLDKEQKEEEGKKAPFRTFNKSSYDIFVGKSAKNNDLLSFKFANKGDLWLHAKDVSGSHVIIRQKPGQNIPMPVLEYAAGLAAYYSKRRMDSIVPVTYTPRKYIRKRKGDPAGMVVVEREEVIMVEPVKS